MHNPERHDNFIKIPGFESRNDTNKLIGIAAVTNISQTDEKSISEINLSNKKP